MELGWAKNTSGQPYDATNTLYCRILKLVVSCFSRKFEIRRHFQQLNVNSFQEWKY